jgi:adenylate cyclase
MEAPELERRLAAILAADVEGYSRLMHGDEEATMATLSERRAFVDELIARHRGRIANTAGDSMLAEFASVLDAVRCAIEIQAALQRPMKASQKRDGWASGSASMSATSWSRTTIFSETA